MRRFRWWLSDLLMRLSDYIAPRLTIDDGDLSDLICEIEPTDTPFLRSLDR